MRTLPSHYLIYILEDLSWHTFFIFLLYNQRFNASVVTRFILIYSMQNNILMTVVSCCYRVKGKPHCYGLNKIDSTLNCNSFSLLKSGFIRDGMCWSVYMTVELPYMLYVSY